MRIQVDLELWRDVVLGLSLRERIRLGLAVRGYVACRWHSRML